ncbi:MAG: hypothetical protein ACRDOE_21545, partial [Streptosporangiaceae bacterium]
VQESGSVKGSVRASVTGVVEVEPPFVAAVWPASEQVAVQATVASWLVPCSSVTATVIVSGLLIFCVSVQVAFVPDALQKPAVLALAAVTPAVIAPAVSKAVKVA